MTLVDRPTEGATATSYALTDRYRLRSGRAFMSGVQALARLPVEQLRVDRDAGLNTAAFVSGYQGSPLGGFDQEVARAARLVPDLPIVCRPAVNEELGATAVMGSQLAAEQPDARYDGVVGIWYGKAPGLDRASDALRHAAFAGTSRHGGAVALVGDDPAAKSSTLPSSSDATLVDLHMPILYPGNVQEVLDLGLHAVALSRLTGAWSAMKIVAAVADGTSTVDLSAGRVVPAIPDLVPPGSTDGRDYVHHPDARLLAPRTLELEHDFRLVRSELIRRYAEANGLNHPSVDPGDAWIGLIASGYTYHQLRDALRRLGFTTDDEIAAAGIRLLHMQMPVTFDPEVVRRFARGLAEVVVVEEKNPTLELLVKDALYGLAERPAVWGKRHPDGRVLMAETGMLDADAMVEGLRERLAPRLEDRMTPAAGPVRERVLIPLVPSGAAAPATADSEIDVVRSPYFCSGCPHNRSTRAPDGSLVGAGIGCHTMVLLMDDDRLGDISGITAMGGEGAQWIGMSPFIERSHFLQNLGDGTFFHSGQLAIQAAVAAGVDITYKLLYNGTVAMTGGQDAVGGVAVPQIVRALLAHGVSDILITTEDRSRYEGVDLGAGPRGPIRVWDRTRLEEAQERLAATTGVTVLINDQACAAHTRQLRKRGQLPTPNLRVAINHRLCEACGDCGAVSNCLSVQAVDTPLGVKTSIDQDSCNLDLSCVEGDCPAFMTIEPGDPAARRSTAAVLPTDDPPDPSATATVPWSVRLTGIGGTGVVTTSQILGTAAMLDGFEVQGLDQTGLSQKAGPVVSDLRFTRGEPAPTNSIGAAGCDVIVALDLLVAATDKMLAVADRSHTRLVGSTSETPTGSMVGHPERAYPEVDALRSRLERSVRADLVLVDAAGWCRELLGSAAGANIFMIGVAVQSGALPVGPGPIEAAIELNGVAVDANLAAFRWGRWWVADPSRLGTPTGGADHHDMWVPDLPPALGRRIDALGPLEADGSLDALLRLLAADLVGYQSEAYAGRFLDRIDAALAAERQVDPESVVFTEATARSLHQLMAYKDEYEVARLLLGPEGAATAEIVGGPDATVTWKLHPPTLAALGMGTKLSVPARMVAPAMKALARGRRLRGTPVDPFGRTEVRRTERRILADLEAAIDQLTRSLAADPTPERLAAATELVSLARSVRGYERLKLDRAATFSRELAAGLAAFRATERSR